MAQITIPRTKTAIRAANSSLDMGSIKLIWLALLVLSIIYTACTRGICSSSTGGGIHGIGVHAAVIRSVEIAGTGTAITTLQDKNHVVKQDMATAMKEGWKTAERARGHGKNDKKMHSPSPQPDSTTSNNNNNNNSDNSTTIIITETGGNVTQVPTASENISTTISPAPAASTSPVVISTEPPTVHGSASPAPTSTSSITTTVSTTPSPTASSGEKEVAKQDAQNGKEQNDAKNQNAQTAGGLRVTQILGIVMGTLCVAFVLLIAAVFVVQNYFSDIDGRIALPDEYKLSKDGGSASSKYSSSGSSSQTTQHPVPAMKIRASRIRQQLGF